MICTKCGFDNLGSEKYCINCGSPLKNNPEKVKTQPKRFVWIILGIVGIFLVIILFILGIISPKNVSSASINKLNDQQTTALNKLAQVSSEEVQYYSQNGIIRYVAMQVPVTNAEKTDPESIAKAFLQQHSDLLQIDDIANQFILFSIYPTSNGTLVHFNQVYQGIPVFASDLIVEVDNHGNALSIHGSYAPNLNLPTKTNLSDEQAFDVLVKEAGLINPTTDTPGKLVIYDLTIIEGSKKSKPRLVWLFYFLSNDGAKEYFIDADSGQLLNVITTVLNMDLNKDIYDANGSSSISIYSDPLKFQLLDDNNEKANQVRNNLKVIEDFINSFSMLNESGLGRKDQFISVFLNISDICDNNQNGAQMDPKNGFMFLCQNSTNGLDVVAHEFIHSLTEQIGPKYGRGSEAAALSESYSDIFAAFIANHFNQTHEVFNDPWVISFNDEGSNVIRNIKDLPYGGYPIEYQKWVKPNILSQNCTKGLLGLTKDTPEAKNNCAHINSTIHTYAAYLIEQEIGFQKTENIFYHTLMNGFLAPSDNFTLARIFTYKACIDLVNRNLFGITQQDCDEVNKAFDSVGIPTVDDFSSSRKNETKSAEKTPTSPEGIIGKIAFTSDRDGNDEIYMMNADGTGVRNLTDNPAFDGAPDWSPDGSRIAFNSLRGGNSDIYVMNADGTGARNLTDNPAVDGSPVWSPDSSRIAFISDRNGNDEIYVMNADGTGVRKLTDNPPLNWYPAWSPDGSRIAFMSFREGNLDIYVMNADGTGARNLTDNPAADGFPAWSQDGSRIAFASTREGTFDIYVMNADGTGARNLTDNPAADGFPVWSPDGSRIAFNSDRDGNNEIYVMDLDGNGLKNLTNNAADEWFPAWSQIGYGTSARVNTARQVDTLTPPNTTTADLTKITLRIEDLPNGCHQFTKEEIKSTFGQLPLDQLVTGMAGDVNLVKTDMYGKNPTTEDYLVVTFFYPLSMELIEQIDQRNLNSERIIQQMNQVCNGVQLLPDLSGIGNSSMGWTGACQDSSSDFLIIRRNNSLISLIVMHSTEISNFDLKAIGQKIDRYVLAEYK